jgi:hypothetical protein
MDWYVKQKDQVAVIPRLRVFLSPFGKLIFTHKLGRWTQGALRQIPHPPPDLPLEGEGT